MRLGLVGRRSGEGSGVPKGPVVSADEQTGLRPIVKDLVFAHIPKTAGTTVRNMLVAAMPDAVKVFDYGKNTASVGGAFVDEPRTPEGIVAVRQKVNTRHRLLVSGHLNASVYLSAFHPASFVTFLRDPVDRIVSTYRHFVTHHGYEGSFEQFIEQPTQMNAQSRMLWGLDLRDVGFIGLTESLPELLPALSRHVGVELKLRRDNITTGRPAPKMHDWLRARVLALNDDDVRLYRHVQSHLDHFTNYRSRPDTGPSIVRGHVKLRGDSLQGWAIPLSPGPLVEIEFKLGARVVHRCIADQFLRTLSERKDTTHGVGGFLVRLPPELLAGHAELRVVIAGTDKDLVGSPVKLHQ
jgi:hypothetical protein